jgi:hypothetical protein
MSTHKNFKVYFWEYLIFTYFLAKSIAEMLGSVKCMLLLANLSLFR